MKTTIDCYNKIEKVLEAFKLLNNAGAEYSYVSYYDYPIETIFELYKELKFAELNLPDDVFSGNRYVLRYKVCDTYTINFYSVKQSKVAPKFCMN